MCQILMFFTFISYQVNEDTGSLIYSSIKINRCYELDHCKLLHVFKYRMQPSKIVNYPHHSHHHLNLLMGVNHLWNKTELHLLIHVL